jgi:hypothetical protein
VGQVTLAQPEYCTSDVLPFVEVTYESSYIPTFDLELLCSFLEGTDDPFATSSFAEHEYSPPSSLPIDIRQKLRYVSFVFKLNILQLMFQFSVVTNNTSRSVNSYWVEVWRSILSFNIFRLMLLNSWKAHMSSFLLYQLFASLLTS